MSCEKEMQYVRCTKCKEILKCSPYDTECLFEHIREHHPKLLAEYNIDIDSEPCKLDKPQRSKVKLQPPQPKVSKEPVCCIEEKMSIGKLQPPQPKVSKEHACCAENERPLGKLQLQLKVSKEHARCAEDEMPLGKLQPLAKVSVEHACCVEDKVSVGNLACKTDKKSTDQSESYKSAQNSSSYSDASVSKLKKPHSKEEVQKLQRYRNSIHNWMPPDGRIYCPNCCAKRPPSIRTRWELETNNSCCAKFIFSCWPFCFLPCLIPSDNREYLHCANCKTFLGIYYREKSAVRPNRAYVIEKCD